MTPARKARDLTLMDALDSCPREPFEGDIWRVSREGRDPLRGYPSGGRWDPGTFDVIYASRERDGALAEIDFHLSRLPVLPSKTRWMLHRITVRAGGTLHLADLSVLEALGVNRERYGELLYSRTQEIGDVAYFLGFDGLRVPSARWSCENLVLFTDRLEPSALKIAATEIVDWAKWKRARTR